MIIFIRQSLLAVPMCLILTSPVFHLGTVQPRYRTISAVTPGKAAGLLVDEIGGNLVTLVIRPP